MGRERHAKLSHAHTGGTQVLERRRDGGMLTADDEMRRSVAGGNRNGAAGAADLVLHLRFGREHGGHRPIIG